MDDTIHAALQRWGNFYLITGTAAAALTGLQFIVQTLLASNELRSVTSRDPEGGIEAFGTPTVVHFTLALVISAVMCVPWAGRDGLRATLAVLGVGALGYSMVVLRRTRRQKSYVPVAEDWLWHVLLPVAAYGGVLACAVLVGRGSTGAFFAVAAATVLLLCVGIHNAWDTVTYLTIGALRTSTSGTEHAAPRKEAAPRGRRRR